MQVRKNIYKPVQRQRKFSHVFGQTSENNSKTTLPAKIKKKKIITFIFINFKKANLMHGNKYKPIYKYKLILNQFTYAFSDRLNI